MASLKDIRKRIQSVTNTRQITRAMRMVAAAKLRRSQEAILQARPYAYRLYAILLNLSQREGVSHPLLEERKEKRVKLVVVAGDRGLCGGFNGNVIKAARQFIAQKNREGVEVFIDCLGKKAFDIFKRNERFCHYYPGALSQVTYTSASEIAEKTYDDFQQRDLDALYVAYNEFKSAIQQKIVVEKLIPISLDAPEGVAGILTLSGENRFRNSTFEPSLEALLEELLPRHFRTQFFRALLESVASEHGARMSAMESATSNASEMIDALTLQYNKARQASITRELIEIIGGVEAMK